MFQKKIMPQRSAGCESLSCGLEKSYCSLNLTQKDSYLNSALHPLAWIMDFYVFDTVTKASVSPIASGGTCVMCVTYCSRIIFIIICLLLNVIT